MISIKEANQLFRGVNFLRQRDELDKARALLEENRNVLAARRRLNRAAWQLREIRDRIERLRASRALSGAEKRRRIDWLIARRNTLVERAVQLARKRAA